jgi:hypothetical protein
MHHNVTKGLRRQKSLKKLKVQGETWERNHKNTNRRNTKSQDPNHKNQIRNAKRKIKRKAKDTKEISFCIFCLLFDAYLVLVIWIL